MRILIDGKACERWGRKEDSDVRFPKLVGPSEGRVLSAEEAEAAAESAATGQREKLILWSAAILLVVVVMTAVIGSGDDGGSTARRILVILAVVVLLVAVNLWSIGARAKERRARLSGGRLPPAGASVSFDETAFTLDNSVIPWASLTSELIVVLETGGEDTTDYHIERIEAGDGERTLLFDRYLYSNGDALVRMAYLKLIRERLAALKR
jgi:hypothetical protein